MSTAFCLDPSKKCEVTFVGVTMALKTCSAQDLFLALDYHKHHTLVRESTTYKDAEVRKLSSLQDKGANKCSGSDPVQFSLNVTDEGAHRLAIQFSPLGLGCLLSGDTGIWSSGTD